MSFKIFLSSQLLATINMAYLSYIHYHLKFGLGGKSLCNINDAFNCDVVNLSPYAMLFGIPISLFGFFTHLLLSLLVFFAHMEPNENKQQDFKNLSFLCAGFALLISLVMAGISFLFLQTYCLFCLLAYILSFISFGAAFKWVKPLSYKGKMGFIPHVWQFLLSQKGVKFLVTAVLLIPFTWLSHDIIRKNMAGRQLRQLKTLILDWQDTPPHTFQTEKALIYSPPQSVKMTILEFADFQCPHCKVASEILHTFIKSRNDVQLVFMPFPLDGGCNPAISRAGDGRSCWLASTVYCAAQQGKGWEMHDHLFEMFNAVERSQLNAIAADMNMDVQTFTECLEADSTLEVIRSQARQGEQANISGTPTLFINGKLLPSGVSWIVLEEIYNSL